MPELQLSSRAAFAGLVAPTSTGGGVLALDRDGIGLATVLVRKGRGDTLNTRVRERFGIELQDRPRRVAAGDVAFVGTGPGAWLATCEGAGNAFAASLARNLGEWASISDQTDGYAVLRLSGARVRDTLAKLVPIDVHPHVFKPGDVASTVAAHTGVILWRLDDGADGTPGFEMAVFRSLARSFWHAVAESAAEFGLVLAQQDREEPGRTSKAQSTAPAS